MTDLINREDVIEEISNGVWNEHELIDRIKSLPSAELTIQTPQTYGKSINPSNAEVVEDYISRADAIKAVCNAQCELDVPHYPQCDQVKYCDEINALLALPSAELPKGDLISRRWLLDLYGDYIGDNGDTKYHVPLEVVRQNIIDAPSADYVSREKYEELYRKAKEVNEMANDILADFPSYKDALSADAVQGDECDHCVYKWGTKGGDEE